MGASRREGAVTVWRLARVFVFCTAALGALLGTPRAVYADSYPHVRIEAEVRQNGDLHVSETRSFEFDADGNGVYWDIPMTYNEQGLLSHVAIAGVSVETEGQQLEFTQVSTAEMGTSGVYTVERADAGMHLMVFEPHEEDEIQQVTVRYVLTGAVMAWADTAELYWQFIGPDWQADSENVQVEIVFAGDVSEAASPVIGENFRAWGHGPLDGEVSLSSDGPSAMYRVPVVNSGAYAEARVVFPVSWVSGLSARGAAADGARLPTILAEEEAWATAANERRAAERERRLVLSTGMVVASAIFTLVVAAVKLQRRAPKPSFSDIYLDEPPSRDHPAVLAAFANNGMVGDDAFISTLVKLTMEGAVCIDDAKWASSEIPAYSPITEGGDVESSSRRYRLRLLEPARCERDDIDGAALRLFFRSGRECVSFDDAGDYTGGDSVREYELLRDFRDQVNAALDARRLVASTGKAAAIASLVIGGLIIIASFVIGITEEVWLAMAASIVLAGCGMVAGCTLRRLTPEGAELKARCDAFVRWAEWYASAEHAEPEDYASWNETLMYAVALGVDSGAVRKLAALIPREAVVASGRYPAYWWYIPVSGGRSTPLEHAEGAHPISQASIAASSDSSMSGMGGGFSGGSVGGGGVGGGGGGSF